MNAMERIINQDRPKVCTPYEKEYKIIRWDEKQAFEAFMIKLGFRHTGVYLCEEGKTVIFY